jgi:hypothetical protein
MSNQDQQPHKEETCYYGKETHCYWVKESGGNYTSVVEGAAVAVLRLNGMSRKTDDDQLSEVDRQMIRIRFENGVDYAGPLSGFRVGLYEIGGRKALVTRTYKLISPQRGEWPVIATIIGGMLGEEQAPYFIAWLKLAYESLLAGKRSAGQAVVFAGPIDSCKSFLQSHVITPVLGGRSCHCYKFLSGQTSFNGDLFEAEHLMVEDDVPATNHHARSVIAANIKSVVASEVHSCHAKFKDAVSVPPFWRLTISVNDNTEALGVLPVLDPSLDDKLLLFKAQAFNLPMPTVTADEKAAFRGAVHAELPAFIQDLLDYAIPPELSARRFGIRAYHHPDVVAALQQISPEERLLAFIDGVVFSRGPRLHAVPDPEPWVGTAAELESFLMRSHLARQVDKVFSFPNACGTLLGRLMKQKPERIEYQRTPTTRQWRILPPHNVGG